MHLRFGVRFLKNTSCIDRGPLGTAASVPHAGHHPVAHCTDIAITNRFHWCLCGDLVWRGCRDAQLETAGRATVSSLLVCLFVSVADRELHSSFFQSVCVLGYCVFPLVLSSIACLFVPYLPVRIAIVGPCFGWCTWGTVFCLFFFRCFFFFFGGGGGGGGGG